MKSRKLVCILMVLVLMIASTTPMLVLAEDENSHVAYLGCCSFDNNYIDFETHSFPTLPNGCTNIFGHSFNSWTYLYTQRFESNDAWCSRVIVWYRRHCQRTHCIWFETENRRDTTTHHSWTLTSQDAHRRFYKCSGCQRQRTIFV